MTCLPCLSCHYKPGALCRLHISQATVKSHLIHIFGKLGVSDRTAAVTVALQRGLIRLEP